MTREVIEAAVAEFEAAGCKTRIEMGGKHPKIIWSHGGGDERYLVCAGSSSDVRAVANQRAQARRMLREAGVAEGEPTLAPRAALVVRGGSARCSSLDIASDFGKAHKDVLRVIDRVRGDIGAEFDQRNFAPISYADEKGRSYRAFSLTRDGFVMVAMGFTGPQAAAWKARYIEAFNAMESELAALQARQLVEADPTLSRLRGDLEALTDIVLSLPAPRPVRRGPWVNPTHVFRQRRAKRRARA